MLAVVDYGVGNLFSLRSSLDFIGVDSTVTSDGYVLEKADRIILPGVGAFGDAAKKLKDSGLGDVVVREARKGKPVLGICLGMQLLFDKGYEYGEYDGLGLIDGSVLPIEEKIGTGLKIPHMGWNSLIFNGESPLFKYISDGDYVYFVHSYYGETGRENVIADTCYGDVITAAVAKDNVYGCQFHPEKSGDTGLKILKAFCEVC